jgi:hypothetical protein
VQRTGIHQRYLGGTTSGLAVETRRRALERANIDPATVDVLILATTTSFCSLASEQECQQHRPWCAGERHDAAAESHRDTGS